MNIKLKMAIAGTLCAVALIFPSQSNAVSLSMLPEKPQKTPYSTPGAVTPEKTPGLSAGSTPLKTPEDLASFTPAKTPTSTPTLSNTPNPSLPSQTDGYDVAPTPPVINSSSASSGVLTPSVTATNMPENVGDGTAALATPNLEDLDDPTPPLGTLPYTGGVYVNFVLAGGGVCLLGLAALLKRKK